nr:immunoglobulin light chain junction region [Macaca mulatta]MOV34069.1 immunoglobulin light chain junction region [Macaca mulatta]MOV34141.1 immunoglobulin light chain junction region [Macaca mulatta]MOV34246.1 immunoglobulin light chain junction region [Macaca mulatta]MOV34286.1 immunoglobulin light chain junction region [Macaca mulatta]
CMQGLEFPITF